MALKGERVTIETDPTLTCETVASEGVVLVYQAGGSGIALGASAGAAELAANPSGYKPAGMLLHDVVDTDLTRFHLNFHNGESKKGERCTLMRKGRLTTDKVTGSPTAGATAYLTANGVLTPTVSATGGTAATPKVGVFAGSKDADGYAAVDLTLPIA